MERKRNQSEDLTGKRFGLLTVLNSGIKIEMECEIRNGSHVRCDCGATFDVVNKYLKRGSKETCGSTVCKKAWLAHPDYPANKNMTHRNQNLKAYDDNFGRKYV